MNEKTISELVVSAEKGRLIIFAGAGLSRKFNLPQWEKMVSQLIIEIGDDANQPFDILMKNKKLQPIQVLDNLKDHSTIIRNYIHDNFIIKNGSNLNLHKKIAKLSGKVITTNYDNAFETANDELTVSCYDSEFNISQLNRRDKFVFKIHGCAKSDAAKCVIFSDDYNALYNKENFALQKLREYFTNYKILFIGFGFKDPFVLNLFNGVEELCKGYHDKHIVLTSEAEQLTNFKYLQPIQIPKESDTDEFIEAFIDKILSSKSDVRDDRAPIEKIKVIARRPKVAILYPAPIDWERNDLKEWQINSFEDIDADIYKGYLNFKTIQMVDGFDYLFIVTKSFKNKLYIEDNDLKSSLATIEELFKAVVDDRIIKVLITDSEIHTEAELSFANIIEHKPQLLKRFIYKVLLNHDLNFSESEIKIRISGQLPNKISKGQAVISSIYGKKQQIGLDHKVSTLIIGRIEDLKIIAEKILSIKESNKILNVKGSGGIGKTSLIKKIGYELHQRGHFIQGVTFRSCENVKSYDEFQDELMNGFKLQNISNFREHLKENEFKLDLLIILDNFETVANFKNRVDYEKALALLAFASDYANIVITSRESLNVEFEDVFYLGQMTTDDALKLFSKNYRGVISNSEIRVLRAEILENLLNNNPLAIKLVTKNSPIYAKIEELKAQLEKYFFESTSEEFTVIYNKEDADINIERTKSIFHSVNYSYSKLNSREKLCFEIIHLFPDGISVSNFKKCFSSKQTISSISDVDIRHLSDKSLVENYEGIVQLQPIIRRFAEYQFFKRSETDIAKFCNDAYGFNCFILKLIHFTARKYGRSRALKTHDIYKNNLFYVLSYVNKIEISTDSNVSNKNYFLNYLFDLERYIENDFQSRKLRDKIDELSVFFSEIPESSKLLQTLKLNSIYYTKDFGTYRLLSDIFPVDEIANRKPRKDEDIIQVRYKDVISNLHSMEGHTINVVDYAIKSKDFDHNLDSDLFYLGIHTALIDFSKGFYEFEKDLAEGSLNISEFTTYISNLFIEEHLERMQCTYTLSKVKPIPIEEIKKLVVTNPYTKGLKYLMYAFSEQDNIQKKIFFEKALSSLRHIKYFYIEAIFYYCKFLYDLKDVEFNKFFKEGSQLANKFKYQFQAFKFNNLSMEKPYKCDLEYYEIDGLAEFIENYIKDWERYSEQDKYLEM